MGGGQQKKSRKQERDSACRNPSIQAQQQPMEALITQTCEAPLGSWDSSHQFQQQPEGPSQTQRAAISQKEQRKVGDFPLACMAAVFEAALLLLLFAFLVFAFGAAMHWAAPTECS